MIRLRSLLACVAVCAALLLAAHLGGRLKPADAGTPVSVQGTFTRNGQFPGEPLRDGSAVRLWGSWAGSDNNTGTITFGPFTAGRTVRVALGGYPDHSGNSIFLALAGTSQRHVFRAPVDVGERWQTFDIPVPPDWIGRRITLTAADGAHDPGGWLAISEPLRGGVAFGLHAFVAALAAWVTNGLLLGILYVAALTLVSSRNRAPAWWQPLIAAGVVATCGYAAFWLYFAHAVVGRIAVILLLVAAGFVATSRPGARGRASADVLAVAKLWCAIGFFYLALLYLYPSSFEPYRLASDRFLSGLPGDNTLPYNTASALYAGHTLRDPGADWLSSDRPPLQAGWLLLTWPELHLLRVNDRLGSMMAAIWLQLLWVPGVYGLLRTLRLGVRRATGWTAVTALTGFCLLNTVYTWPKLSAGAFACGAFALWFLPAATASPDRRGARRTGAAPTAGARPHPGLGALLAGLAWMSHGGVAFSYLPLAPAILLRLFRGEARRWILAAGIFALFALPWAAYQRFYDPPGNRLLKWHLAGQEAKDPRGAWTTIREAYHALPWHELIARRIENFQTQIGDGWADAVKFSPATADPRRNGEFFHLTQTLTWWLLAVPLAGIVILRRRIPPGAGALTAWILSTLVVWCLLMFEGGQAIVHQGSYTVPLACLALLAALFEAFAPWTLALLLPLQGAAFATTWMVPNGVVHGTPVNWPFVAVGGVGLLLLVMAAWRLRSAATRAGARPSHSEA